jgi:hypothetical protein
VVASNFLRTCDAHFNFELSLLLGWIARGLKLNFEKCDDVFYSDLVLLLGSFGIACVILLEHY